MADDLDEIREKNEAGEWSEVNELAAANAESAAHSECQILAGDTRLARKKSRNDSPLGSNPLVCFLVFSA